MARKSHRLNMLTWIFNHTIFIPWAARRRKKEKRKGKEKKSWFFKKLVLVKEFYEHQAPVSFILVSGKIFKRHTQRKIWYKWFDLKKNFWYGFYFLSLKYFFSLFLSCFLHFHTVFCNEKLFALKCYMNALSLLFNSEIEL